MAANCETSYPAQVPENSLLDIVRAVINISAENAARAFSNILNQKVKISISDIKTESQKEKINSEKTDEYNITIISKISGLFKGLIMFNMNEECYSYLSSNAFKLSSYEDKKDLISETINIVHSAQINAIANTAKDKIRITTPIQIKQCNIDSYINPSKEFICINSECITADNIPVGTYILFIEKESLKKLLSKINDSKILICDDTAFMRYMIKDILNKNGNYIFFDEAKDGEEAIQKYIKIRPDLVIMDTVMPVCDGITATTKILEFDPDAKIILSSATAFQVEIIKAIKAGAKDFLLKPYDINRVLESINKLMEDKKVKVS